MTATTLTVPSRRFGDLEVAAGDLLDLPEGLAGLGGRRYVVVPTAADSPFAWLQSADDPDLALPITDPWAFFPEFVLELSDDATAAAGLPEDPAEVRVWVTVRAAGRLEDFCANLRAPIVVHQGRGAQVLNEAEHAAVRAPLFPESSLAAA
jgi:flagellar assembly factor FliW